MQANKAAHANTQRHEKVFEISSTPCGLEGLVHRASTGEDRKRGWEGKQNQITYVMLKKSRLLSEGFESDVIKALI